MKEVGELFKAKREEIGITIEEISKDLNIDNVLIENLEKGNDRAFKDILELKNTATKIAKYLGLDIENIIDEINNYIFDKTTKISPEDIKNAVIEEEKKIKSPYTIEKESKKNKVVILAIILILIVLVGLYFLLEYLLMN